MTTTHEAKAKRDPVEYVLSRLSIQTTTPKKYRGSSGIPEFTTSDIAAAAAGYRDPVGQHILGVFLGDVEPRRRMEDALGMLSWMRWRTDRRDGLISNSIHNQVVKAAIDEFCDGEARDPESFAKFVGLRPKKDKQSHLIRHCDALVSVLMSRKSELAEHIRERLER